MSFYETLYKKERQLADDRLKEVTKLSIDLKFHKDRCRLYEALLGLRDRCEMLERELCPTEFEDISDRGLKWKVILEARKNHFVVKQLRERILQCTTIDRFVKILSDMYQSYSNNAVYKVRGKIFTKEELDTFVTNNMEFLDDHEMMIIKVLFLWLDLNPSEGDIIDNTIDDTLRCIRLKIPSDVDMEEKIKTFFRSRKSITSITKERDGVYLAEFSSLNEAVTAFLNHEEAIDNHIVDLSLTNTSTETAKAT